jgi:hypothetical protein
MGSRGSRFEDDAGGRKPPLLAEVGQNCKNCQLPRLNRISFSLKIKKLSIVKDPAFGMAVAILRLVDFALMEGSGGAGGRYERQTCW